ncbi:MORN repeat-containing protein [Pseudooceanicola sp.]|uniref:MORN repeat-containing protein n=1 Tax=Pseudooceanicola sp. TaxID=1914328 RepID=UPI00405A08B1
MTRRLILPAFLLTHMLAAPLGASPQGAVQERLHVLYDAAAGEVVRRTVRVIDPHPELTLDFRWDPAPGNWPGVDADGFATGQGVLTWRIEGLADYDPRALHHRYEGGVRAGRFEGRGVLTYRDGAEKRGHWVAGLLEGPGESRDAEGNSYAGEFVNDVPEGLGVWRGRDGTVYEGGFVAGRRHGAGEITEPGGLRYAVRHDMGRLIESARPDVPDPLVGGLLPAQGGDAASNVSMALGIDMRVSEYLSMQYVSEPSDGQIFIFPKESDAQNMWNGTGWLSEFDYTLAGATQADWDESRAYLVMDMTTNDGSRERLSSLDLVVSEAAPHLQPMLRVSEHFGCVGFRPGFSLENHGWGAVDSATAQVRFVDPTFYNPDTPLGQEPGSGWFELPMPAFSEGADIDLRALLAGAGVDVDRLETERFTCPSPDLLDQCRADLKAQVAFGQVGPWVNGWDDLRTRLQGQITYGWTDAAGAPQTSQQWFQADIPLLKIETPAPLAECGDGGALNAEAPRFQHVELRPDTGGYSVNIPVRGNPNVNRVLTGLALWSKQTSWHRMQIEASFADGSTRSSPVLHLFFLHPRQPNFTSRATPASCYLNVEEPSC